MPGPAARARVRERAPARAAPGREPAPALVVARGPPRVARRTGPRPAARTARVPDARACPRCPFGFPPPRRRRAAQHLCRTSPAGRYGPSSSTFGDLGRRSFGPLGRRRRRSHHAGVRNLQPQVGSSGGGSGARSSDGSAASAATAAAAGACAGGDAPAHAHPSHAPQSRGAPTVPRYSPPPPMAVLDYELILMLDPQVADDAREKLAADAKAKLEAKGEIKHEANWGMRKMAYEIEKRDSADYRVWRFTGGKDLLDDLDHSLKITDGVLRFRVFKVDADSPNIVPPDTEQIMRRDEDDRERVAAAAAATIAAPRPPRRAELPRRRPLRADAALRGAGAAAPPPRPLPSPPRAGTVPPSSEPAQPSRLPPPAPLVPPSVAPTRGREHRCRGAYTRREHNFRRSSTSGEHQPGRRSPGNLTRDPEVRNLPSGTTVCELGVAVNHRRKDQADRPVGRGAELLQRRRLRRPGRQLRPVPLEGPPGGGRRPAPLELVGGQERRRQALEGRDRRPDRAVPRLARRRQPGLAAATTPADRQQGNQGTASRRSDVPADTSDFGGEPGGVGSGGGGSDDDIPF